MQFCRVFILLLFLAGIQSADAKTVLEGMAIGYEGESIAVTTYTDYFSYEKIELAKADINALGGFKVELDLQNVLRVDLEIGNALSSLYVQPDTDYKLQFPENRNEAPGKFNETKLVNVQIVSSEPSDLNKTIVEFNNLFDSFVKDHYVAILRRQAQQMADTFRTRIYAQFNPAQGSYMEHYMKYSFALLDLISNHPRDDIYKQYLADGPIAYQSETYGRFFQEFYKDFFKAFYFMKSEVRLVLAIQDKQNLDSLYSVLGEHRYLARQDIKELVAISEVYYSGVNGRFPKPATDSVVEQIANRSEIKQHQRIARYFLKKSKKLREGTKAPELKLTDLKGNPVSLSQFKGRYVYIDFWATWSAPSLRSKRIMKELYPKYKDYVEFVSISMDQEEEAMSGFLETNRYPWKFAHFGKNPQIKSDYEVVSLPYYYLVDPEGNLVQSPAKQPESGIEYVFAKIKAAREQEVQPKFWDEKPKK